MGKGRFVIITENAPSIYNITVPGSIWHAKESDFQAPENSIDVYECVYTPTNRNKYLDNLYTISTEFTKEIILSKLEKIIYEIK